jgi:hypothetical protein
MGVWRLESHGYNAAAEIPMIAELAMHVGDLVPARLSLQERRAVKDGQTSRFVVPVLDLDVNTRTLVQLAGGRGGSPALEAAVPSGQAQIAAAPAVPAAPAATPLEHYGPQISACQTREELNTLWQTISAAGHTFDDVVDALKDRARIIDQSNPPTMSQAPADPGYQPPTDATLAADGLPIPGSDADRERLGMTEHVEAELFDDDPDLATDRAWQDVVAAAGRAGWTTAYLTEAFEEWAALPVSDGDALMFRRFLAERLT